MTLLACTAAPPYGRSFLGLAVCPVCNPQVTDLDVFRQLVLNRLTADDGASRSAQRAAGSAGAGSGFGSSPSKPASGRAASFSSSAAAARAGGGAGVGGGSGGADGEPGWGWQARQTQLALWIEEARKG